MLRLMGSHLERSTLNAPLQETLAAPSGSRRCPLSALWISLARNAFAMYVTMDRVRDGRGNDMTETEWLGSTDPAPMLHFLSEQQVSERKMRLLACACCRRIWQMLPDP